MKTNTHIWLLLAQFFLNEKCFETKFVEKIEIHMLCSIFFFLNLFGLWDNMETIIRAGQAKAVNMTYSRRMVDT